MQPSVPPIRCAGRALLIMLVVAVPQRAWAGPGDVPLPLSNIATSSGGPSAKRPCRCRYDGRKYKLGAVLCMTDFNGGWRALKCGMELNNTSWIVVPGGCQPVS